MQPDVKLELHTMGSTVVQHAPPVCGLWNTIKILHHRVAQFLIYRLSEEHMLRACLLESPRDFFSLCEGIALGQRKLGLIP